MLKRAIEDGSARKEAPVLAEDRGKYPPRPHMAQVGPPVDIPWGLPSPVLRVDRNGILQDANEPGRAMLRSLGCHMGKRLPEYITQLIPGVLLSGRREKALIDCEDRKQAVIVTMWYDPQVDLLVKGRSSRPLLVLVDDEESEFSALRALPVTLYTSSLYRELGETWVSPGVEELTGYLPSSFTTGVGFWMSKIHPEDRPAAAGGLAELRTKGKTSMEYRFLCANGSYKWMLDTMVLPPGLNKGHGILQTIDDRKKKELSADERSNFLEQLMEGASHGIILLDDHKCLAFMSPKLAAGLGFCACDWVTRRTKLAFHPEDGQAALKAISRAMRGARGSCKARLTGPNGNSMHVRLDTSPIQWRGRRFVQCTAQDLSEQIRAEAERTATIGEGLDELLGAACAALAPGTSKKEALAMMRRHLGEKGNALLETFGKKDMG